MMLQLHLLSKIYYKNTEMDLDEMNLGINISKIKSIKILFSWYAPNNSAIIKIAVSY